MIGCSLFSARSYRIGVEDVEGAQHGSPAYEDVLDEVESEALQAEYPDMVLSDQG